MNRDEKRSARFLTESEILAEFEGADAELARQLLGLRQIPSAVLQQRIQAIPQTAIEQTATVAQPPNPQPVWRSWRRMLRPLVVGVGAGVILAVALLAISPGFRAAAAQAVGEIRQLLGGGIATGPGGISTFRPAPPFNVKQPDYLPEGFKLVAQRYNPGPPEPRTGQGGVMVTEKEIRPQLAGPAAQEAVERDRGREAYIVLVYEAPDGRHVQLFERAALPDEALPAGESRAVGDRPASLQRSGQTLKLTRIDEGTWIELEGTVSEAELLRIAEGLATTQTLDSGADGRIGGPAPVVPTSDKPIPAATREALDRAVREFFALPYCNPDHRVPFRPRVGEVKGQQLKGWVTIQLWDHRPVGEYETLGYSVNPENMPKNVRQEVLEPALAALQDPTVPMQRLSYPSLSFRLSDSGECKEPDPNEEGYVVIEVWDDQVNIGYGGIGDALKERAIRALEQELQKGR